MNLIALLALLLAAGRLTAQVPAAADWPGALAQMPLAATNVAKLGERNCVDVMLRAFSSNGVVKALVFMPGATDEFYMFHRAQAVLSGTAPTLLDAVTALTNQSRIRVTFRAPYLLLHTDEDPLEPLITVNDPAAADKLRTRKFLPHALFLDTDWPTLLPVLEKHLKLDFHPWPERRNEERLAWHFYRHSFAAWGLDGWEALEVVSLAGKETVTLGKRRADFAPDERTRARPTL